MRRFLLSSTLNTRDLGGYSIDCRNTTAYKAFLRSVVPIQVSDDDIELLLSNNITTIVDLRSDDEVKIKHRTGAISALLLLFAGVCKTDILANYQISQVYLEPMLQQYCKIYKDVDINIITPQIEIWKNFWTCFN